MIVMSKASLSAVLYVLAILVAGFGPHCARMMPMPQMAVMDHAHHAGHQMPEPPAAPNDPDCGAMLLAKAVAPLPVALAPPAPDILVVPVMDTLAVAAVPPEVASFVAHSRAPPDRRPGFADVFASNHRLLI